MIKNERLFEILKYDQETGDFIWVRHFHKSRIGKRAGHIDKDGYRVIIIDKKPHRAHNLAWIFSFGKPPDGILDHRNGDPRDNRIENLRECSVKENAFNSKKNIKNTSGVKGVSWRSDRNSWEAVVKVDGVRKFRRLFKTIEEAENAVRIAREEFHGEFANHG
jgi:hypothetical protein